MVEGADIREREIVKNEYQSFRHADYHARQFTELYRSTAKLIDFVRCNIANTAASYKAIDVGCGGGC